MKAVSESKEAEAKAVERRETKESAPEKRTAEIDRRLEVLTALKGRSKSIF